MVRWIHFLVDNCYVQWGDDAFRRQTRGIPMGEACSGMLANMYLYTYEYDFMHGHVLAHRWHMVKRFAYTRRYIDDIATFNNRTFAHYRYLQGGPQPGIYLGQFLTLNEETRPQHFSGTGQGWRFLDLWITTHPVRTTYVCNVIRRTQDPRKYQRYRRRYITHDTLLARGSKYNVATGQLHRFHRLCMSPLTFVHHCARLLEDLHGRGFDMSILRRQLRKFLRHQAALPGRATAWHKYRAILYTYRATLGDEAQQLSNEQQQPAGQHA